MTIMTINWAYYTLRARFCVCKTSFTPPRVLWGALLFCCHWGWERWSHLLEVSPQRQDLNPGPWLHPWALAPGHLWLAAAFFRSGKAINSHRLHPCNYYNISLCSFSHVPLEHRRPFLPMGMGHCNQPREQLGGGWHCLLCGEQCCYPRPFPPGKLKPEWLFLLYEQTQRRGLGLLTELIGAEGLLSRRRMGGREKEPLSDGRRTWQKLCAQCLEGEGTPAWEVDSFPTMTNGRTPPWSQPLSRPLPLGHTSHCGLEVGGSEPPSPPPSYPLLQKEMLGISQ